MYIKRLEIVGFKSFPERALVPLSQGISAVVGPNGCGKSNIIDAIRWVMGEQSPKMLRGRNMDDVLFNGSQGRPASALAEVTLTLARDADPESGYPTAAETSVTRRLYRSGDSEYLINKQPCRLKDVVNFFTDHGVGTRAYGIIEQGRVGWLVDARPEERRGLIDEAAGITRYKQQKKEAERKIESAEANLVNVSVIKAETKKQLDQITRAAAKAARFKALKEELRELDLALSARALTGARDKKRTITGEREENRRLLTSLLAEIDRHDLEMENIKLEVAQVEKSVEEKTTAWHQMVAARDSLTREADYTRSTLGRSEENRVKALGELAHISSERRRKLEEEASLNEEMSDLEHRDAEAREKAEQLREQWAAGKSIFDRKSHEYEQARGELTQAEHLAADLTAQLAGAERLLSHHQSRLTELQNGAAEAENIASETASLFQDLGGRKNQQASNLQDAAEAAEFASEALVLAERRRAESSSQAASAESKLAALQARLEALEGVKNNFGWYPEGVKALMDAPELQSSGLIGPLAEYLETPDGYEEAVEAALGERLAWLLVENRGAAVKALHYADEHKLGRCGFVCKDELSLDGSGLTRALLGDYQLADDLLSAAGASRFVLAKNGHYAGGALVAGGRTVDTAQESASLLARLKEVENLRQLEESLDREVKRLKTQAQEVALEAEEKKEAAQVAESAHKNASTQLAELEKKLIVAESEASQAERRLKGLREEVDKTQKEAEELANSLTEGRSRRTVAEEKARQAQEQADILKDELREQGEAIEDLRSEMEESRTAAVEAAGRLERGRYNLENISQWLSEAEESLAARESETEALAAEIDQLRSEAEALERKAADFPEKLQTAENELAEARSRMESVRKRQEAKENAMREVRRRREDLSSVLTGQETDLLGLNFSLDKIEEGLKREWRVVMPDFQEKAPEETEAQGQAAILGEGPPDALEGGGFSTEAEHSVPGETEELTPSAEANAESGINAAAIESEPVLPSADQEEEARAPEQPEFEIIDPRQWLDYPLPEEAESKRDALKTKIGSLGEVSLGAIEREAELKTEYDRYQSQYDDLTRAISDLKDSINRINHTCKIRFAETFQSVNEKFKEIFPILFEGGEGWLSLTNEDDPLESGVEIHVHPPGKKVLVMSLLSGGEKALTALALIFALYLIKPSPFCLLDETDAPLDEANIDRFNRLLQQLSKASQIIMVTHNKRTMQISHTLYGVTMETPGVSRLVSVNLAEAEALTTDV